MASTIKVTNIDTPDSTGNITVDRPLAGSGASLTALNATQLTTGTIPIARIADDAVTLAKMADDAIGVAQLSATGTASNTTFLRGDNAWAAPSGGKILQHKVHSASNPLEYNNNMTTSTEFWSTTFTPTASNSTVLINVHWTGYHADSSDGYWFGGLYRGASQIYIYGEAFNNAVDAGARQYASFWHLDSPATTSQLTYKMMPYYGVSYSSSHFHISRMRAVFFELAPN